MLHYKINDKYFRLFFWNQKRAVIGEKIEVLCLRSF
jgi:hypothetical protein